MPRSLSKRAQKYGLEPGALVHVGESLGEKALLRLTTYDADSLSTRAVECADLPPTLTPASGVVWLDVAGVYEVEVLRKVGALLNVHPLVLEDIANTRQRPKVEFHDDYLFAVMRVGALNPSGGGDRLEQVSFLLGKGCLVTLRERPGPLFDPVLKRLEASGGRLRKMGADFLFYSLLDLLVDQYFVAVEELSDLVEALEVELLSANRRSATLLKIHQSRHRNSLFKRAAWPLREVASSLLRGESPFMTHAVEPYLRDLSDHVVQVVEMLEVQRETLTGFLELSQSISGNRLNSTMAFLTVIATIFIPLTFIVGVYGMNFKFMPELEWRYGYAMVWAVMFAVGGGMYLWFRRNKWL